MAELGPRPRPSRRSRVIGALKILLPMLALALLGSVLLWRTDDEPGVGLTFSEADLESLRAGLRLTRPQLSGASALGDLYDFRAEQVVPENLDMTRVLIETLSGRVEFRDGRELRISSENAVADFMARQITLETGIVVETSDGYTASAELMTLDVETSVLTAEGPVFARGPLGEIEAGGMRIAPADDADGVDDALIRFEGGVKLRYTPKSG